MNALVYIPLLALTWCLGFLLAVFAAHYFLVVLDNAASGSERVIFPDEPLVDWFGKVFYLAWIGGVWMAPLIILGGLMSSVAWVRLVFTAGSFWLLFPIGLLSSRSANSPWMPFWPGLFARMGQRKPAVIGFYLLSIPISFAFVGCFYLIAMSQELSIATVIGLAPVAAAGFLVYARALGRLGLVLTFTKGSKNEPKTRKKKAKKKEDLPKIGEHTEQPINKQPSEMPPMDTPYEGPISGYDVQYEDRPTPEKPAVARKLDDDDEDSTTIAMTAEAPDPAAAKKSPPLAPPSPSELALWDKSTRIREPKQPWDASLVAFLLEPRAFSAWLLLTAGLAFFGVLIYFMRELRPA